MSKDKTKEAITTETVLANPQGKTVEELKDLVQNLQIQKNQHQEKANQAQAVMNSELTMATKAQGALEVMLQLIPKEEVEKMMAQEAKDNRENGELVEG